MEDTRSTEKYIQDYENQLEWERLNGLDKESTECFMLNGKRYHWGDLEKALKEHGLEFILGEEK